MLSSRGQGLAEPVAWRQPGGEGAEGTPCWFPHRARERCFAQREAEPWAHRPVPRQPPGIHRREQTAAEGAPCIAQLLILVLCASLLSLFFTSTTRIVNSWWVVFFMFFLLAQNISDFIFFSGNSCLLSSAVAFCFHLSFVQVGSRPSCEAIFP